MSNSQVVVFDESCLRIWSSRKPRNAKKEQSSAQSVSMRAEQVLLNEIIRVCLQKAADLRSVIHPDGLHITMNDCVVLATEKLIQDTDKYFEQYYQSVRWFNPVDAPVVNDWINFRFTYRLPEDLYQEVAAAIVCWRRMSGINLSFSLFINYAVVAFLQQEGFVFYDYNNQPILDTLTLYQTPEAELSKIELSLNSSLHNVGKPSEKADKTFFAVCYPDNRWLTQAKDSQVAEINITFRIPAIMSRLVNMCSCAHQLQEAEQMREYDPDSGMPMTETLQPDADAEYSFDNMIRQAMLMYMDLQKYAEDTQQTIWGEPYAKVFNDAHLLFELPPQTTEHPERKIEYHRFVIGVTQSMLNQWRQYSGSDSNKLMMALTVWLQLQGLYICDATDDEEPRLADISLWQYCRMATGHEKYVVMRRDFKDRGDDKLPNPSGELSHLIYDNHPVYYLDTDDEL